VIKSYRLLSGPEVAQLMGKFLSDLANFDWKLDIYRHIAAAVPIWAAYSALAIYFDFSQLFQWGSWFVLTRGWITLWFFADGIWRLLQLLLYARFLWKYRYCRRITYIHQEIDERLKELAAAICDWDGTENEWIEKHSRHPHFGKYYRRLLRRLPPIALDVVPRGFWEYIKLMILGVPIRVPLFCYPVYQP